MDDHRADEPQTRDAAHAGIEYENARMDRLVCFPTVEEVDARHW
jgi:hypothetical protein